MCTEFSNGSLTTGTSSTAEKVTRPQGSWREPSRWRFGQSVYVPRGNHRLYQRSQPRRLLSADGERRYDYDCPVSECGDLTEKYFAIKRVAEQDLGKAPDLQVGNLPKHDYGRVQLTQQTPLFAHLPQPVESASTLTMEQLEQDLALCCIKRCCTDPLSAVS